MEKRFEEWKDDFDWTKEVTEGRIDDRARERICRPNLMIEFCESTAFARMQLSRTRFGL